jgi:hypothetical protein
MIRQYAQASALTVLLTVAMVSTSCANLVAGTATWPGAKLEKGVLTAADFPPGVVYDRIIDQPGQPGGGGSPASAMLSRPPGCSDGLTDAITATADRGKGSAATYRVGYDGAIVVMTVMTSPLDLEQLKSIATRCEKFYVYFDPTSHGIPITTRRLQMPRDDELVYQQTMSLSGAEKSVYASFENIGGIGVFGTAVPIQQAIPADATRGSTPPKAQLPQTFLDIVTKQSDRLREG